MRRTSGKQFVGMHSARERTVGYDLENQMEEQVIEDGNFGERHPPFQTQHFCVQAANFQTSHV